MPNQEQDVILLIADISGYTRFMTESQKAMAHGQVVITELMQAIIKHVEIPLEVAKLEGDAIFLYAVKDSPAHSWDSVRKEVGQKLVAFFEAFSEKLAELIQSNVCVDCPACANIHLLKLKIVVHSGKALMYRIGKFEELSGVDVIIVHRLLKNSVNSNEYILMTESAYQDIGFPSSMQVKPGEEEYDSIGKVRTYVYFPNGEKPPVVAEPKKKYSRRWYRWKDIFRKGVYASWVRRGWKKMPQFRNLGKEP